MKTDVPAQVPLSAGLGLAPERDAAVVALVERIKGAVREKPTALNGYSLNVWAAIERDIASVVKAAEAAERERWVLRVEAAFREGFNAPATYNDSLVNDVDDEWARAKASLLAA